MKDRENTNDDEFCPGYGNCAHVQWPNGRVGACRICIEHPGRPRPPVKGRGSVTICKIIEGRP